MATLRALIVDDSRTAQYRLKKLLDRYDLEVDLAISAEEALGYLSYKMPTVIFMDHHMEGMDGLNALKILKANPTTATIPVIMYTSKSDELYAGQAHALGALDTLSKSLMKPERVEEVLAKLRIYPRSECLDETGVSETEVLHVTHHGEQPPYSPLANSAQETHAVSATELKGQIARLFELHIADVRTQIAENTKFVVRRLASEIKNSTSDNPPTEETGDQAANDQQEYPPETDSNSPNWLFALILVGLGLISFQVFEANRLSSKLQTDIAELSEATRQNSYALEQKRPANTIEQSSAANVNRINYSKLLDTLNWALSVDMHFPYGETPLNESQILTLQTLTFHLQDAGFRGLVELDIQLGDYCLRQLENGEWALPAHDSPLSECLFLSEQAIDLSAENYTSLAYLQFEQSAAPVRKGDIEFMIAVSGFDDPRYEYPDRHTSITAGQWNAVAEKNQHVAMSVEASEDLAISTN